MSTSFGHVRAVKVWITTLFNYICTVLRFLYSVLSGPPIRFVVRLAGTGSRSRKRGRLHLDGGPGNRTSVDFIISESMSFVSTPKPI
jgi:hypothetical protein